MAFTRLAAGLAGAALALSFGGGAARAGEAPGALLAFGAGYFDIISQDAPAADFRLEYRHEAYWGFLRPWAGLEVTTDGGVWVGAGIQLEWMPVENLVLSIASGPGYYHEGSGKDLGGALEFRTQMEIAWQSHLGSRLALALSHHSNADIYGSNPGVETLMLYYQVPLTMLFD
jgi:lipid A 3-O-deacylase